MAAVAMSSDVGGATVPAVSVALPAPFETALQEASQRLLTAHAAALATLEAELQHMRMENMRLRLRLAEAGLPPEAESKRPVATATVTAMPATEAPRQVEVRPTEESKSLGESRPELQVDPPVGPPAEAVPGRPSDVGRSEPVTALSVVAAASTGACPAAGTSSERRRLPPQPVSVTPPVLPSSDGHCRELLVELLKRYGLHELPVSQVGDRWSLGGQLFLLREAGCDLLASHDGGSSWELLEALLVQHLPQLQALGTPGAEQVAERQAASIGAPGRTKVRMSSQQYTAQEGATLPTAPDLPAAKTMAEAGSSLPAWRSDGLPTFHNAFPQSFNALSGATQYYSQFRVRVPSASQYEASER